MSQFFTCLIGSSGDDDILKYGAPDRGPETLVYTDHIVGYDQSRKIPLWVAEHITAEKLTGTFYVWNSLETFAKELV